MVFYCITYILNALASTARRNYAKMLDILVLLLLVFMSGTRYYMGGNDVYVYENFYNNVPSIPVVLEYIFTGVNHGVNENYESGFTLIASTIKALGFNYFGFILLYSILFYTLMYVGLRRYATSWQIMIAIFMYKIMFYDTFISIRQGVTIAIFFIAMRYMEEGSWLKYFALALIATFIHRGAALLLPLYFLRFVPISKNALKWYAIILAPTYLVASAVDISGILDRAVSIVGFAEKSEAWTEATEAISVIHTLECYIVVAVTVVYFDRIKAAHPSAEFVMKFLYVLIPIFTLLSNWIVLTREKDYFVIAYGLILGYLVTSYLASSRALVVAGGKRGIMDGRYEASFATLVALLIFGACFIGMVRYVIAFDSGVLIHFDSFLFHGESIFRGSS